MADELTEDLTDELLEAQDEIEQLENQIEEQAGYVDRLDELLRLNFEIHISRVAPHGPLKATATRSKQSVSAIENTVAGLMERLHINAMREIAN